MFAGFNFGRNTEYLVGDFARVSRYNGLRYVSEHHTEAIARLKGSFLLDSPKKQKRVSVFLSYSRKNTDFTIKLAADLRKANLKTWRDAENIPAGANWDREIEKAIKDCTHVILISTPSSVEFENVLDEISLAINKGKPVIPVMLETCDLPMRVHRAQWVDFRSGYEGGLAKLLTQLGVEKLIRDTTIYPLSRESIKRRYENRAIVRRGLRLVPKDDFDSSAALGTSDRKYVFIGDYEEQRGRTLKQIMNNLWLGDVFDLVDSTKNEWIAIVFDIDEANYRKFDVMPATWKGIFRILSHPSRLNIIRMTDDERNQMGMGVKDYYEGDQNYWLDQLNRHPEIQRDYYKLLEQYFGLRTSSFAGEGITYARGGDSSVIESRIFLVKNHLLSLIEYEKQELGQPSEEKVLT